MPRACGTHRSRQNLSEKSLHRLLSLYLDTGCIVFGNSRRTRRSEVDGMTVGEVAKRARVHIETLRYYERRGLLVKPLRSKSNYRQYADDTVWRVRFIKAAQALGFSLKEIQELLSLQAAPEARCAEIRTRAENKITDIDAKIDLLITMKYALSKLVEECSTDGPLTDCPILAALENQEDKS
jgi:MerR family transcriptional regulator, copper efflux regulator